MTANNKISNTKPKPYSNRMPCFKSSINLQKQIHAAFETWQSVCGLKFKRVEPDEECEIKITFLNNHDEMHGLNCPYKLSGQKWGTLAHAFYPGKSAISGDTHILIQKTGQTKKQLQEMVNTIYFPWQSTNLAMPWDFITILKTKTVLCNQFINQDLVTGYFLNLTLKQSKKCMAQQEM